MTTVKTTSVLIKTDDSKGSGSVEYDATSHLQEAPIKLQWAGTAITFNTVAEYQNFLIQVIIPMTDVINSPSGVGSGFIASSAGVAGSDKINN